VIVDGVEWLKVGENRNNEAQNRNNGVLKIPMVSFCFYNRTQRELTHADLSHVPSMTQGYTSSWVNSRRSILSSLVGSERFMLGEEQFFNKVGIIALLPFVFAHSPIQKVTHAEKMFNMS